ISDFAAGSNPQFDKYGQGDIILSGQNTYGGVTEIKEGQLIVHQPLALGAPTAVTSEVQSLTLAALPGTFMLSFTAPASLGGATVVVAGLTTNAFFNGTYAVTATTATSFSYALTHADVAGTADSGTAIGSVAVGVDEMVKGGLYGGTIVDPVSAGNPVVDLG